MRDNLGITKYWEYILRVVILSCCFIWSLNNAPSHSEGFVIVMTILWVIMLFWNHNLCIGSAGVTKLTEKGFLYIDKKEFTQLVKDLYFKDVPDKYKYEIRLIANNMLDIMKHTSEQEFNAFIKTMLYKKRTIHNDVTAKVNDDINVLEQIKQVYEKMKENEGDLSQAFSKLQLANELLLSVAHDMSAVMPKEIENVLTSKVYTNVGAYNGGESPLGRMARTLSGFYTNMEFLLNGTPFDAEILKLNRMQENLLSEKKKFESDQPDYESHLYREYMYRMSNWVRDSVDHEAPVVWSDINGK